MRLLVHHSREDDTALLAAGQCPNLLVREVVPDSNSPKMTQQILLVLQAAVIWVSLCDELDRGSKG